MRRGQRSYQEREGRSFSCFPSRNGFGKRFLVDKHLSVADHVRVHVPAVSHDAVDEDPTMVTARSSLALNLNLVAVALEFRCHNLSFFGASLRAACRVD